MVLKMERVNAIGPSEPATFHHLVVVAAPAPAHRDQDATSAEQRLMVDGAMLGGFNRSSQHPDFGGVADGRKMEVGALDATQIILARSTASLAT